MSDVGVWQGLNQTTGNILNTALNFAQLQQHAQHQRALESESKSRLALEDKRIGVLTDQADREKKAWEYAEKDRQQKEKEDNAFVAVSLVAPHIHNLPTLKSTYVKTLKEAGHEVQGMPDGELYVTNKAVNYIKQLTQTKTDFMKTVVDSAFTDLQNQSIDIGKQITQLQESGKVDEKTLTPLLQKQMNVKKQIGNLIGTQKEVQVQLAKEQAEMARQLAVEGYRQDQENKRASEVNATRLRAAGISAGKEKISQEALTFKEFNADRARRGLPATSLDLYQKYRAKLNMGMSTKEIEARMNGGGSGVAQSPKPGREPSGKTDSWKNYY